MHEATGADSSGSARGIELCDARVLQERGLAHVWDVLHEGQVARAFALRIDGRVVAYLNRCVHVAAEMDWNPGEFLDANKKHIVCSLHGATYTPATGHCSGGPCGRGTLVRVDVAEEMIGEGSAAPRTVVRWYPSSNLLPLD